jgi:hypothetical protein
MTPEKLQELFGTEVGRVYSYTGGIPDNTDPTEHITHSFAEAAGTNLVDCVVTNLGSGWLVYTRNISVTSGEFMLLVELPLPELEVEEEQPAEQQEGTP